MTHGAMYSCTSTSQPQISGRYDGSDTYREPFPDKDTNKHVPEEFGTFLLCHGVLASMKGLFRTH